MKTLCIALVALLPLAGFSQSLVTNSWFNPGQNGKQETVHTVVIAALLYDQTNRRNAEDYAVSLYPGVAIQSYKLMGDSLVKDEAVASQKMKAAGYDGILIMKQTGSDDQQQYIPGRPGTHYTTWAGYWSNWGPHPVNHWIPGTPGHVVNDYTWFVQVSLYSLNTNTLLYTANTTTTKPGGMIPLFDDVSNVIRTQLSGNGIIM